MHDTFYVVLHWWVWLAVALFGAATGFAGGNLLALRRPGWTAGKRILAAALIAPLLILLGAVAGILLVSLSAQPGDWSDLAVAAMLQLGATLALAAGLAGLGGAALAGRAEQP